MAGVNASVSADADGKRGSFREMLGSPIWWVVTAIVFDATSNAMLLSYSTMLIHDQLGENALLYNNIAYVTCSMIFLFACPVFGYISQPHRCGRKQVLVFMALMNVGYVAVIIFWKSAIWILVSKVALGALGGGPSPSYITVTQAWATDWIPPHQKAVAFGFLSGSTTLGIAFGGLLATQIAQRSHDLMLCISLGISVAQPLFLASVFPNILPRSDAAPEMSQGAIGKVQDYKQKRGHELSDGRQAKTALSDIQRRYTIQLSSTDGTNAREIGQVAKVCFDTMFVIKFLFMLPQRRALIVYILMGLVETGLHDSLMLFMRSERGFNEYELSYLPMFGGVAGSLAQFLLTPLLECCGSTLSFMMLLGSVSAIGSCLVYAYCTDKGLILAFGQPLVAVGCVAVVGSLAALSKARGPAGQNQGLLIGVATGLKTLISASGPLGLALLLQHYRSFPHPFNFAGFGFTVLAVILIPGVWCSFMACLADWMEARAPKEEAIANDLSCALIDE